MVANNVRTMQTTKFQAQETETNNKRCRTKLTYPILVVKVQWCVIKIRNQKQVNNRFDLQQLNQNVKKSKRELFPEILTLHWNDIQNLTSGYS